VQNATNILETSLQQKITTNKILYAVRSKMSVTNHYLCNFSCHMQQDKHRKLLIKAFTQYAATIGIKITTDNIFRAVRNK